MKIIILFFVFLPLFAIGQIMMPGTDAALGSVVTESGGGCTIWINQNEVNNIDTGSSATNLSQSIAASAQTVCQVDLYIGAIDTAKTTRVEFRDAANGGGSRIGDVSDSEAVLTAGWYTFTWSGTKPSLGTGTVYLTLLPTEEIWWGKTQWYASQEATPYTGGSKFVGATEEVNKDWSFKVYIE